MQQAVHDIKQALGEDSISTDDEILHAHGYSDWSTCNIDRLPVAVAYPKSTEEVSQIAKICFAKSVPMSECVTSPVTSESVWLTMPTVPYSGGSSVEGHFSAPFGGVSIDFSNMNQILKMHSEE